MLLTLLKKGELLTLTVTSLTNTAEVKWDTDNEGFISIIRFFDNK